VTLTLEHRYRPRGSAKVVLESRAPELLVSGPAGTGKSRACLEKLLILALNVPSLRGLIVRKTKVSLASTALETWEKHVASETLASGYCRFFGGSPRKPPAYNFKNGSTIVIGGMDQPSRIMSSEYDIAYAQEATELTVEDWEAITTRLRNGKLSNNFHQILADANPDVPTHWLKERCDNGTTVMLESRHEENPRLFDDQGVITLGGVAYMARLDALTGVRKQRLRYGRWVAAEGIIYEDWDPDLHLVSLKPWDVPAEWTRWWAIDWGHTNPCVLQWWAEDPDGRLVMYREIYHTKLLVEDLATQALLAVTKVVGKAPDRERVTAKDIRDDVLNGVRIWTEPRPRAIICDHDSGDRATFEKHAGLKTTPAKKKGSTTGMSAKRLGIEACQARYRVAGDGRARIQFARDCVVERDYALVEAKKPASTVEEIPGYVWAQVPGQPPKETPADEDNHGMDAKRYLVSYRDSRGRPGMRWL
jgi:hypothetical protein